MHINIKSPKLCIFCEDKVCYDELPICSDCISKLWELMNAKCRTCGKMKSACSCFTRGNIRYMTFFGGRYSRDISNYIKSVRDTEAMNFLVELLVNAVGIKMSSYDAVAFVPRLGIKRRRIGVDQSREMARSVSKLYGIPMLDILKRKGGDDQKLLSYSRRLKNIKGRIRYKRGFIPEMKYKRILIVDDVITTGATMQACILKLRGSVSRCVVPLALMKTNYHIR